MRWLLDHGADANARGYLGITPLIQATDNMHLEAVQVLLEHNADANLDCGIETPLLWASGHRNPEGMVVEIMRRLLEHGADPNIRGTDQSGSTPLHLISSSGFLEAAQLLLSHGAKVDEKDKKGRTPFQLAASKGHDEVTKLLLEHGAVPQE